MILSFGTDKKIYIYENDNNYKRIQSHDFNDSDWINNVEIEKYSNNKKILLNVCTNNQIYLIKINLNENSPFSIEDSEKCYCSFFSINNDFVLIQNNKVSMQKPYNKSKYNQILKGYYKNGITINKTIFAITSNRIINGGEDKISFYNTNLKQFCKEIKGYSFILSSTGLYLLSKNNEKNILLCACKKYLKRNSNEIESLNCIIHEKASSILVIKTKLRGLR